MDTSPPTVILTDRQRAIICLIVRMTRAKGYPPSVRELCEALGIVSTNGVLEHLDSLARKGLVEREVATARSIRVTAAGLDEIGDVDIDLPGVVPARHTGK